MNFTSYMAGMYSLHCSDRFRGGARSIASFLATSKNTKVSVQLAIHIKSTKTLILALNVIFILHKIYLTILDFDFLPSESLISAPALDSIATQRHIQPVQLRRLYIIAAFEMLYSCTTLYIRSQLQLVSYDSQQSFHQNRSCKHSWPLYP